MTFIITYTAELEGCPSSVEVPNDAKHPICAAMRKAAANAGFDPKNMEHMATFQSAVASVIKAGA